MDFAPFFFQYRACVRLESGVVWGGVGWGGVLCIGWTSILDYENVVVMVLLVWEVCEYGRDAQYFAYPIAKRTHIYVVM